MTAAINTVKILYFHCILYYFSVEEDDEDLPLQPDERSALKRLYSSSLIFLIWSANAVRPSANLRPNLRRPAKRLNIIPVINKKTVTRSTKNGIKNSAAPNNIPASTGLIILRFIIICFNCSETVCIEDGAVAVLLYVAEHFWKKVWGVGYKASLLTPGLAVPMLKTLADAIPGLCYSAHLACLYRSDISFWL